MAEIVTALGRPADYLGCAVGTAGTLTGCARYIREHQLNTSISAVDAIGSVLFAPPSARGRRLIPGHCASVRPALLDPTLPDRVVHVSDLECVIGCRRLALREAVLPGGSSGGVVTASERVAPDLPAGSSCVLIFPHGGGPLPGHDQLDRGRPADGVNRRVPHLGSADGRQRSGRLLTWSSPGSSEDLWGHPVCVRPGDPTASRQVSLSTAANLGKMG